MTEKSKSDGINREISKARTTDAGDGPSLTDVLKMRDTISTYVAMNFPHTPEQGDVLNAIAKLTDLARLALSPPSDVRLRHAVMKDPYTRAAYAAGQAQGFKAAEEEYYGA